jgi:predicted dehydrogenase
MTPLRTTLVGCGAVAQRLYLKPLKRLEQRGMLQIVALVDPVRAHADALAGVFPNAVRHADLDGALAASRPDLTLILSPAHLHCNQTIAALRHGSHVLCEKPMAATDDECARMNAVAAHTGRVLAVGMIRRFFPAYQQLRQLLEDGRLGKLRSFEYREGHKFEWDVTTPAAFRPRTQGGTGVLFDIGPHVVDHLEWTFGPLNALTYRDDALAGIESNMSLELEASACRGAVHLSWNAPQANELRVVGEQGEAVLRVGHFDQLAVKRSSAFEPQLVNVSFPADAQHTARRRLSPRSYSDAMYCQIVQVVRAITLQESPAVDGETGRRAVALLESALAIAQPLEMPWLTSGQRDSLRTLHWRRTA